MLTVEKERQKRYLWVAIAKEASNKADDCGPSKAAERK